MRETLRNLAFAVRLLRKSPGFAATAVLSLGLGLGTLTLLFSWIERVLLDPVAGAARPGELVAVQSIAPDGERISASYPDYRDFRDQSRSLQGLIAFHQRPLYLGDGPQAERVWVQIVSPNYFDVLGVTPVAGTLFGAGEVTDDPGKHPVVVISEAMWRGRFGGDPGIAGRPLLLNGVPVTVRGVAPDRFRGTVPGLNFDVYAPLSMEMELTRARNFLEERRSRPLVMIGRLAPGATAATASAEVATIAARLAREYPRENEGISAEAVPMGEAKESAGRLLRGVLIALGGAAVVLFLLVCANVGGLLVARAAFRRREFGIRASLGASGGALARQLLAESLVLAAAGGVLGLLVASWLAGSLEVLLPRTDLPVGFEISLTGRALAAAAAGALVATLLVGLAPALRVRRLGEVSQWAGAERSVTGDLRTGRSRSVLVSAQIALALVALAGAFLFLRSFDAAQRADPGFDARGVFLAGLDLAFNENPAAQNRALLRRLQDHLASLPGVEAASLAEDVPLGFSRGSWEEIAVPGYTPQPGENMKLWRNVVAPGYFATMRIPVLEGRDFTARDESGAEPVAVVNETFARRYCGGSAVGRSFTAWGSRQFRIVGVVRDSRIHQLNEAPLPYFYVPLDQLYHKAMGVAVLVRTAGAPAARVRELRQAIAAFHPGIRVFAALPLEEFTAASRFVYKVGAAFLGVIAPLCLALAALGLYGVVSYLAGQRTREIGVRVALGATPGDVRREVLGSGAAMVWRGLAAGVVLALAAGRMAAGVLYGVAGWDPASLAGAVLLIAAVALAASWIPAWRAARLDPLTALRQD
jgi:predicted permease